MEKLRIKKLYLHLEKFMNLEESVWGWGVKQAKITRKYVISKLSILQI